MSRAISPEATDGGRRGPPKYRPVPGSAREPLPHSYIVGSPDPSRRIEVTVLLRPPPNGKPLPAIEEMGAKLPSARQYITREAFAKQYGADPADIRKIVSFASQHRLRVVGRNVPARTLHLAGTIANFSNAFKVTISMYRHPGGCYRGRVGFVNVPAYLHGVIVGVFGLDNRPAAKTYVSARIGLGGGWPGPNTESLSPDKVAQLYNFPAGLTGAGQCIGVIELGGGYRLPDVNANFQRLKIPRPQIAPVHILGARNRPTGHPHGPDSEVMLDIEVAGALAPGAKLAIYFAPNTGQGFLRAVNRAVHDRVHRPSIIAISWGKPEEAWTHQAMNAFENAFKAAAALGITVCVASGDGGYTGGLPGIRAHVDFPASSPSVLSCGGTSLLPPMVSPPQREAAWNDGAQVGATGGGISNYFPLPVWQVGKNIPTSINPGRHIGRGIPDVAADASPYSGYEVRVDGVNLVLGGTSATAPLWAALIALINESLGTAVGYWNPLLYSSIGKQSAIAFNDITQGDNDMSGRGRGYSAGLGWDACTGFGSPNGAGLLAALQGRSHTVRRRAAAKHHRRPKTAAKQRVGRARK
jgi:kumamolisin